MRDKSPSIAIAATLAAALLVGTTTPSQAHHRPNLYCSESGDLCQSTRRVQGGRKLGILLAARYFRVFHICVAEPRSYESCIPFRIHDHGDGTFGRDVSWRRHFPPGGPGPYTVRWVVGDERVGRVLGFHVH
ncbi:MAG: hypothetical protein H0U04_03675 [Rubrobacter sp.]|nr:hypothetical protein [Rubrobacter sp.]